jgi:hypothetical protein
MEKILWPWMRPLGGSLMSAADVAFIAPLVGLLASAVIHLVLAKPATATARCPCMPLAGTDNTDDSVDDKAVDMAVHPFQINISQAQLQDLQLRLKMRIPAQDIPRKGIRNELGVEPGDLETLVQYWETKFDWPRIQASLNSITQFTTVIDGVKLHFIHVKAPRNKYNVAGVVPLLLIHGWPQTVFDYRTMIPYLTDPISYGDGRSSDAFDVVVPSMPGYCFSGQPAGPKCGAKEVILLNMSF